MGDVDLVPSLDVFLAWCANAGFGDRELCQSKFNDLKLCGWRDSRGKIVRNWPKFFLGALRRNRCGGAYAKLSDDIRTLFDGFWNDYPKRRRVERDKCAAKFRSILLASPDPVRTFNAVMDGLAKWKASSDWTRNGGEYVMQPYRWLNNAYWETTPGVCTRQARRGVSQTANVHSKEVGRW